ncbi:MAG TPA: polysaccharide deacetylase family protein [Pseudonocardiaceae bacterium]
MRYLVLRPPYCYRWAALITTVGTIVALAVVVVQVAGARPTTDPVAHPSSVRTATAAQPAPVPVDLVSQAGSGDTPRRVVALTFDDGPHPEYTPQVLNLLVSYRAVATFCIVGVEAQRHPELVRATADAGMALCSHTMSHDENLVARPDAEAEAEIVGCRQTLLAAAGPGATVPFFRAPAGRWSDAVREIAGRNGMRPLSWSVDSRDWQRPGAAQIVAAVQRAVQPGAVILLHDGGGRRDQTIAALATLLPWLVDQGYGFALPG